MRLFVCGNQKPEYIQNTLEYLDDKHYITDICGSAASRCMDTVIPWAEANKIPITVYIPEELSIPGMIAQNTKILQKEYPYVVLIYNEDEMVIHHLIKDARDSPSVEYVIKEIS